MEVFFAGYCRVLDGARTVLLDTQEREADCAWPLCPHRGSCPLAQEMEARLEEAGASLSAFFAEKHEQSK